MAATKKKAAKKKATKKKKLDAAAAAEKAKKRHASVRARLIHKFANESTSIEHVHKKIHDVTGKRMTQAEEAIATLKLAEKILRGKRR